MTTPFAALILTGGASSRMGTDKAALEVGGVRAVDHAVGLALELGARMVFTVGRKSYGHPFLPDPTPLGGPVGGILTGAAVLGARGLSRAIVLAVDIPTVRVDDLRPLFDVAEGAAFDGLHLPFVADLSRLPADAEDGWPIRRLVEALGLLRLAVPAEAAVRLRGANTPDEFQALTANAAADA